jgi:hypothetical protein
MEGTDKHVKDWSAGSERDSLGNLVGRIYAVLDEPCPSPWDGDQWSGRDHRGECLGCEIREGEKAPVLQVLDHASRGTAVLEGGDEPDTARQDLLTRRAELAATPPADDPVRRTVARLAQHGLESIGPQSGPVVGSW